VACCPGEEDLDLHTFFIWKTSRFGLSETRHVVRNLGDLRDLLDSELRDRVLYLEARQLDDSDEVLSSHLRSSAEDLTEDDFRWLTDGVRSEMRGVRA
jgi:hypothetical protein